MNHEIRIPDDCFPAFMFAAVSAGLSAVFVEMSPSQLRDLARQLESLADTKMRERS